MVVGTILLIFILSFSFVIAKSNSHFFDNLMIAGFIWFVFMLSAWVDWIVFWRHQS